jgi:Zn-dependent protease
MLQLLYSQQYALFALIIITLIISLTFHEFGHAASAKLLGDDTAQRMGRLNVNPIAHIDPIGLLMVVLVGFGYAKPVPTNPNNYTSRWGIPLVAAAGPAMNLLLAFVVINIYFIGVNSGNPWFSEPGPKTFFIFLASINLLLMLFNLIPLGPLDGHYILGYFLPGKLATIYLEYNRRYGHFLFLGLILLSILGIPIFSKLMSMARSILPMLVVV